MQTRSCTVEMPSGLSLPFAFGVNTRLIGTGRYVSCLGARAGNGRFAFHLAPEAWRRRPRYPLPQSPLGWQTDAELAMLSKLVR